MVSKFKKNLHLFAVSYGLILFAIPLFANDSSSAQDLTFSSEYEMADRIRAAAGLRKSNDAQATIPELFEFVIQSLDAQGQPNVMNSDFETNRMILYGMASDSIDDLLKSEISPPSIRLIDANEVLIELSEHAASYKLQYLSSYNEHQVFREFETFVNDLNETKINSEKEQTSTQIVTQAVEEATALEPKVQEPASKISDEPAEKAAEKPSNWLLWFIGGLVVLGGLALVVRRKN